MPHEKNPHILTSQRTKLLPHTQTLKSGFVMVHGPKNHHLHWIYGTVNQSKCSVGVKLRTYKSIRELNHVARVLNKHIFLYHPPMRSIIMKPFDKFSFKLLPLYFFTKIRQTGQEERLKKSLGCLV